tara:strand:- start:1487 stop:1813 length:327 start_codon:yes stop_codon:yes gene_type:complete
MTSYYEVYCEGCETEHMIEVEGYIGLIDNYWCNDCGYDGEFMSDDEPDEEETDFLSIENIRAFIENGDISDTNKETLELALHMYDKEEDTKNRLAFHKALHLMIKYCV